MYKDLRKRWEENDIKYLGDKYPLYDRSLSTLTSNFKNVKFVYIFRDLYRVADSFNERAKNRSDKAWPESKNYQYALKRWHESLSNVRNYWLAGGSGRLHLVSYERLFCGDVSQLDLLGAFLGLPFSGDVVQAFKQMTRKWDERQAKPLGLDHQQIGFLKANKNKILEQWFIEEERMQAAS